MLAIRRDVFAASRGVMTLFGGAASRAESAAQAVREAATLAKSELGAKKAALAILFASASYEDLDRAPAEMADIFGDAPVIGGTAGGAVFSANEMISRGAMVACVGGDDVDARVESIAVATRELHEVVVAARKLGEQADEAARRGLAEFTCLAFAPAGAVDGDALVAAIRKGASARAQLAGGLTGDDFTFDRARVIGGKTLSAKHVVLAGIFTKTPIGLSAKHGYSTIGPARTVTRSDDARLILLDGRPAVDVWLEDIRAAGGSPPEKDLDEIRTYLANTSGLGVLTPEAPSGEPVPRTAFMVHADKSVTMAAALADGAHVRVMRCNRDDLENAARASATGAVRSAGGKASGALFLPCSGRLAAMQGDFPREIVAVHAAVGAPVVGSCVFGEIARARRDVDAFYNLTAEVVAFPK